MTTQDKLADALLAAKYPHIPCAKYDDLLDFHFAVDGEGPLAYEWSDKPHRLVFRLTTELSELRDSIAAIATAPQPTPKLEKWKIDSMQTLADALEKRGDDLSTDSASWLRKYLMLAAAPQPTPDECFCDRMYPDSNPNASCGDCPTRDYAPKPAPAPAADGAGELPPLPPVDGYDKRVVGHYSAASMHAYARTAIAAADAEDAYVIDRLSQLLARIAIAVKGPEKPLSCHGYHDLPELIEKLVESQNQFAAAGELPPLPEPTCLGFRNPCGITQLPDMGIYGYTADQVRACQREAIAALRQPVPDAVREDVLIRQLRGRAAFLRNRGRVKSPALMEEAASRLESAIASQQESRNG